MLPPPREVSQEKIVPVVLRLKDTYGIWQKYLSDFPKANRFTLGSRIDAVFLTAIEYCFLASYSSHLHKIYEIEKAISRIDLLKLLFQLSWEIGALGENKFILISQYISEIGKMLGGWKKSEQNKTSETNFRKK